LTEKNKFRIEESIGSLIDMKLVEHRTWFITTSINKVLQKSLREEMFNQGSTLTRVFRITKQHLELQCRLAATTRFLIRPISIDNPTWLLRTRVPYNYYTLTSQSFYFQWTNFRGWDLPRWRTTVTRVHTQFQIHLGYPQHLLLALVQEWQVLGVERLELPVDFFSSSIYWSLCCNKKFCSCMIPVNSCILALSLRLSFLRVAIIARASFNTWAEHSTSLTLYL
jgi:hypothetical protein